MTTAYWCVLIMILFPYFFTVIAKISPKFNNAQPREYLANLTGWRKRANYVQLNCFESNPAFGLAVVIANLAHAPPITLNNLAIIFVFTRVVYAIFYLANMPALRTLSWLAGIICIVGLFYISA